jgi:hypothetical protein
MCGHACAQTSNISACVTKSGMRCSGNRGTYLLSNWCRCDKQFIEKSDSMDKKEQCYPLLSVPKLSNSVQHLHWISCLDDINRTKGVRHFTDLWASLWRKVKGISSSTSRNTSIFLIRMGLQKLWRDEKSSGVSIAESPTDHIPYVRRSPILLSSGGTRSPPPPKKKVACLLSWRADCRYVD